MSYDVDDVHSVAGSVAESVAIDGGTGQHHGAAVRVVRPQQRRHGGRGSTVVPVGVPPRVASDHSRRSQRRQLRDQRRQRRQERIQERNESRDQSRRDESRDGQRQQRQQQLTEERDEFPAMGGEVPVRHTSKCSLILPIGCILTFTVLAIVFALQADESRLTGWSSTTCTTVDNGFLAGPDRIPGCGSNGCYSFSIAVRYRLGNVVLQREACRTHPCSFRPFEQEIPYANRFSSGMAVRCWYEIEEVDNVVLEEPEAEGVDDVPVFIAASATFAVLAVLSALLLVCLLREPACSTWCLRQWRKVWKE